MKQKFFKTLITLVVIIIAVAMATTNVLASVKENESDTQTITVNNLETGVTVNLYQLTTVNYDYTADQLTDEPYTWASTSLATWLSTYNSGAYSTPEKLSEANLTADEAKQFYADLLAAINAGTITDLTKTTLTANSTSVDFTGCAMGTYLVEIEGGTKVYSPSVVDLVPTYDETNGWTLSNAEVEAKPQSLTITKTVGGTTTDTDNYSSTDTIEFTIVADVPKYLSSALATKFMISDTLSDGLTLDTTSIKVYGDDAQLATTAYTLTTTSATNLSGDDVSFSVDFSNTYFTSSISGYSTIKVTYSAKLNTSSTLGETGNTNTATLEYSNNPYTSTTSIAEDEDTSTVYTYGIELTKIKKGASSTKLAGAQFTVSDGSDTLYFVKTADGVYYKANSTDSGATQTVEVSSSGVLTLKGLDEGTYTFTETKAPDGYNIASTTVSKTLTDDDTDGSLEVESVETYSTGILTFEFGNSQGFTLPTTGGMGTYLFVGCGIILIIAGVALIVVRRKKNN